MTNREDEAPEAADDPAVNEAASEPAEAAPVTTPEAAKSSPVLRFFRETGELLRDYYLTFDRRALGFTRLMLGFYLLMDLCHRGRWWKEMYSTDGVLPNNVNLFRPQAWGAFTIFNSFSSSGELWVLWAFMLAVFGCLFVGYKTKAMQVLSLVLVTGMNGRVLLIENGGYVVQNLLLLWTCFLPLGDRFSVDALLASMKRRREASADELNDRSDVLTEQQRSPHVTIMGFILMIQLAAIYFFNVLHKTGANWKNGTAVHYVIYVDRMATPLVAAIRDYIPNWAIIFMTKSTLAFEAGIPVALLSPLGRVWSKRLAIVMINALHIAFGFTFCLGPFAWACCIFSTLLFSAEDWDIVGETMRREHRARTVIFNPGSPGAVMVCRLLKRFDQLELLTFEEGESSPLNLTVVRADGRKLTRAAAFGDIVAALPLGPLWAWPFRAPLLSGAINALCASIERRDASANLGLTLEPSFTADGPSPLRRGGRKTLVVLRELIALAMFAGAVNQAMVELWVINRRIKVPQPEALRVLAHKARFLQGWFMFSPNPVMDDGTVVVDAITIDGRHVDPFSIHVEPYKLREPNFDLLHAKSLWLNQSWGDYFNRIHLPGNTAYRDAMKEYMFKLPERTGNPNDAIVSGEVFWVVDQNPRWNEKESYKLEKNKLFSFENPAVRPAPQAPTTGIN
jgi:Vitamin K-dependent gamma-carboxylase